MQPNNSRNALVPRVRRPIAAASAERILVAAATVLFVQIMAVVMLPANAARANQEFGTWLTDDRKAKVELRECGEGKLCSEIVWLEDPLDEKGQPWRDELNPDPSMRRRKVVGIDILVGLKKVAERKWTGQIYDPEEGKYYYLKHIFVRPDRVEIRGCLSSGWPCRTKYWTRTTPVRAPAPPAVAEKPATAPQAPARQQAAAPRQVTPPAAARPAIPASRPEPVQRQAAAQPEPQAPARKPAAPQAVPGTAPTEVMPWQGQVASATPTPATPAAPQTAAPTGSIPRPMAAAPAAGDYLVQVTAGQNQNEALRAFGKLQRRFPQLLGGYLPNIEKVDLGEKGVWYRVRVGPMEQRTAAITFCEQLKAAGGDCLIRRK